MSDDARIQANERRFLNNRDADRRLHCFIEALDNGLIRIVDYRPKTRAKHTRTELTNLLLLGKTPPFHLAEILQQAQEALSFYEESWDEETFGEGSHAMTQRQASDALSADAGERALYAHRRIRRALKALESKELAPADGYRVALQALVAACYGTAMEEHPAFLHAEAFLLPEDEAP